IDAEGEPVEGVVLRLGPAEEYREARTGPEPVKGGKNLALNDALSEAARETLEWRRASRETRSAADGSFVFAGLPDSDWRLKAFREGYGFRAESASMSRLPTGAVLTLLAEPYVEVSVALVRADGQPVDEAVIDLSRADTYDHDLVSWTPDPGTVWLRPGVYEVTAYSEILWLNSGASSVAAAWKSDPADWVVEEQDNQLDPIELSPAQMIHGTIQYAPRVRAGRQTRLILERFEGPDPPDDDELGWSGDGWLGNRTRYHQADLTPGRYVIGIAQSWNGPPLISEVIDYPGGVFEHDILVDPAAERPEFSVTVRKANGDAVLRAALRVRLERENGSAYIDLQPFYQEGAYRFAAPKALVEGDEDVERVWLQLIDSRFAPAEVQLTNGVTAYQLAAAPAARVVVQVEGFADPAQLRRTRLSVSPIDDDLKERGLNVNDGRARLDSSGLYRSKSKVPGRYRIDLRYTESDNRWNWGQPIDSTEVTLDQGETFVTLTMPPLHSLEVLAPDYPDDTWFEVTRAVDAEEQHLAFESGERLEEGACLFENLPAGRYTITASGSGNAQMEVVVPGPAVTFSGREPNAYEVQILDEEGQLAEMGFLSGDFLLAVDGDDVAVKQLGDRNWNLLHFARGVHTARVMRGKELITLEWDVDSLSEKGRGARLTPTYVELE
ncbi:MAG: hypothetical protein AAFZ65_16365, partial [Planctomycetota bacterium]